MLRGRDGGFDIRGDSLDLGVVVSFCSSTQPPWACSFFVFCPPHPPPARVEGDQGRAAANTATWDCSFRVIFHVFMLPIPPPPLRAGGRSG